MLAPMISALVLLQGGLPSDYFDDWVSLLNRLFTTSLEYQVEVRQAWVDVQKLPEKNAAVDQLIAIQAGEGMYGTHAEAVAAFEKLSALRNVDGSRILAPVNYRIARSSAGRRLQECLYTPSTYIIIDRGVTVSFDTLQKTIALGVDTGSFRCFEPDIIMQPSPFVDSIERELVRPWEKVSEATYRTYYIDEDHTRQRSTVRMEESGVPLGYWMRRRRDDDSIASVLIKWGKTTEGQMYPMDCIAVSRHGGVLIASRFRTMHWVEPVPDDRVVAVIPRPVRIVDARDEGFVKTIHAFKELPNFVQQMFVLQE